MGDERLGGQCTFDQVGRCGRLHGLGVAISWAGIFWTYGDDDPELGGHDVEPLGTLFADFYHLPATAGAADIIGLDDALDAGQFFGQMPEIAFGLSLWAGCGVRRCISTRFCRLDFRRRRFQLFEG